MYSELMKKAVVRTGLVTFMLQTPQPGEYRCVIAYRRGSALNVMSSLSDLYHFYDLYSTRCVGVRSGPTPALPPCSCATAGNHLVGVVKEGELIVPSLNSRERPCLECLVRLHARCGRRMSKFSHWEMGWPFWGNPDAILIAARTPPTQRCRKYVEQFSNGMTFISMYLRQMPKSPLPPIMNTMPQLLKEVSLLFLVPRSDLHKVNQPVYSGSVGQGTGLGGE
jgi:hypothetical protein